VRRLTVSFCEFHAGSHRSLQNGRAAWQRCGVHFMRNVLAVAPRGNQEMIAAAIRTIFAEPDAEHFHDQLEVIATMLGKQLPKVEVMLRDATKHDGPGQGCTAQGARRHQAAGVDDRVRTAAQTIYQALNDAQLTAVIGADHQGPSPSLKYARCLPR
jgi:Transposase, Mutator family